MKNVKITTTVSYRVRSWLISLGNGNLSGGVRTALKIGLDKGYVVKTSQGGDAQVGASIPLWMHIELEKIMDEEDLSFAATVRGVLYAAQGQGEVEVTPDMIVGAIISDLRRGLYGTLRCDEEYRAALIKVFELKRKKLRGGFGTLQK